MKFARVLGTVVATQKYQDLEGIKFLVVQPLDEDLQPDGLTQVAADATAQSAPGAGKLIALFLNLHTTSSRPSCENTPVGPSIKASSMAHFLGEASAKVMLD